MLANKWKSKYSQKISLSRRTLEKQYVQHSYRKKRYFTNKNRKIGFKKIDQELPIWISEALKELEHQPAETSNKK